MIKWKCLLCETKCESEVKPALGQRLCKKCLVRHYKTVVEIYKAEGGFRLEEAKRILAQAVKEARGNDEKVVLVVSTNGKQEAFEIDADLLEDEEEKIQ